ncbi:MAG: class I SAM-dependent methyltransferase [Chitinophagaceae bacterium]|nr:MAG: class I SAM-dependent methyltransferase [Chitinophagaceae bacterium]
MSSILDQQGYETLQAISDAKAFNKWMYDTIAPYLKGAVIEIGSGIGNISEHLLTKADSVYLTDLDQAYCDILKQKFGTLPNTAGISQVDLVSPEFELQYRNLINRFDSLIALNVIEHIENDDLAISNAIQLIKPGGQLIILVPAYQFLYNKIDKKLSHYRRYTKKSLTTLLGKHSDIIHNQYFNLSGIPGWFVSGGFLNNDTVKPSQMSLFNKLVPVFKIADKVTFNQAGLSVIAVSKKAV